MDHVSHSDMLVHFHVTATPQPNGALWNYLRLRYTTDGSSCSAGAGGSVQTTIYSAGRQVGPQSLSDFRVILAGVVAPGAIVNICPELSLDSTNWSNGAQGTIQLLPLPSEHPAKPELPHMSEVPLRPNTAGFNPINVTSCDQLTAAFNDAYQNQKNTGTVIQISSGLTCTGVKLAPPKDPADVKRYDMDIFGSDSGHRTVTLSERFPEGQGFVFGGYGNGQDVLDPVPCNKIRPGSVYFAHYGDSESKTFQLTCEKPLSEGGTIMGDRYPVTLSDPFNAVDHYARVAPYPRSLNWIVIRPNTDPARFAAPNTRISEQWLPKMVTFARSAGMSNEQTIFHTSPNSDATEKSLTSKIWIEGIHFKGSGDSSLLDNKSWIYLGKDASDIVFSQNWFDGAGNRGNVATIVEWNGLNTSFLNNLFTDIVNRFNVNGSQSLIGSYGPGPHLFIGNRFQRVAGNIVNFDEGGKADNPRNDYLVYRNYFRPDFSLVPGLSGSGEPELGNRHPLEFKSGHRILIDGNIFDQSWRGLAANTLLLQSIGTDSYGLSDITIRNNTFQHVFGGINMGVATSNTYDPQSPPINRFDVHDNIFWDVKGYYTTRGSTNTSTADGRPAFTGWVVNGLQDGEDQQFRHNTIFDVDGTAPDIIHGLNGYAEGTVLRDNFLFIRGRNADGGMNPHHGFSSDSEDFDDNGLQLNNDCQPFVGQKFLTCHYPNIDLRQNVLLSELLDRNTLLGQNPAPDEDPQNWFPGSGWLIPSDPTNFSSAGWQTTPATTYFDYSQPLPNFQVIPGTEYSATGANHATDGKDIGADIPALKAAQGEVSQPEVTEINATGARVSFVAPDSFGCSVDVSGSDTQVVNDFVRFQNAGGARNQSVVFTGLTPGVTYNGRVNCQVQQPTFVFTTSGGNSGNSVVINSPANGAVLTGLISVYPTVQTNFTVQRVDLLIDGVRGAGAYTINGNYVIDLYTDQYSDGNHTFQVVASGTNNETASSATITVTFQNHGTGPGNSVVINSPANGAVLTGLISVYPTVQTNFTAQRVDLMLDGVRASQAYTINGSYVIDLYTDQYSDGNHTFQVVASGTNNETASSATITVTFQNHGTGPGNSVVINSPANGAVLSGLISVYPTVQTNFTVDHVDLLIDGVRRAGAYTINGNYVIDLYTDQYSDGNHTFQVVASGTNNEIASSATITVTFQNHGTGPGNSVVINSPANGAVLTGLISVYPTVQTNFTVDHVDLLIDGVRRAGAYTINGNYVIDLYTDQYPDGNHTFQVLAVGTNNETASSATITVAFQN